MTELAPIFTSPVQLQVRNEVLKIQTDEYSKANIMNDVLNKDITTMRRQVEIIEDSALRKNNTVFVLKTFMTYFVLILIPILLAVKGLIGKFILYIILAILTLLLLLVVGYNTASIMKRDKNRFMNKRFKMDPKLLSTKTTKSHKCILSDESRLTPEEKQIKEYERDLRTLTKNLNLLSEQRTTLSEKQKVVANSGTNLRKIFEDSYSVDTTQYFKSRNELKRATLNVDNIPPPIDTETSSNIVSGSSVANPLQNRITRQAPKADAKCSVNSRI